MALIPDHINGRVTWHAAKGQSTWSAELSGTVSIPNTAHPNCVSNTTFTEGMGHSIQHAPYLKLQPGIVTVYMADIGVALSYFPVFY